MSLPLLGAEHFPAFFEALHGYPPFPWQARLVAELAARNRWPDLLDLPTGSGKTAAIDAAVFHLALQADRGAARAAPMRIAFVVDRRLVVDEAAIRATRIAEQLATSAHPIVRAVKDRLSALSGAAPLVVRRLRGGVPREDDWAATPCQPTVLCSTVDQVGSRLLFRGYGVSDSMAPVQAGLLGSDALILLDEAHLSQPFRQTIRAVASLRSLRGADDAPFHAALLSATPGEAPDAAAWRFGLDDADRATPTLATRLRASKPGTMQDVPDEDDARSKALAEAALTLIGRRPFAGMVVGVVANRIARARAAHRLLSAEHESVLVIGRSRPVDRDRIAAGLARIRTGADRPVAPLLVVGTQALEAGADLDFDALVTEAASLDALRQRFGRVDRAGRGVGVGGVVLDDRKRRGRQPDPIYGGAIGATMQHLFPTGGETVDFGIEAMDRCLTGDLGPMLAPRADAPVLMPAYVALWSRTAPKPMPDPDPALFLHGPDREPASVQLVWRDELDDAVLGRDGCDAAALRAWFAAVPPRAGETIELPLWAARAWLETDAPDLADVEQATGKLSQEDRAPRLVRRAFRWRGGDDRRSEVVEPGDVRAGDVLVVPASYGGCDEYGWNPGSTEPVADVFDAASGPWAGRRFAVRVTPALASGATPSVLEEIGSLSAAQAAGRLADIAPSLGTMLDRFGTAKGRPDRPVMLRTRQGVAVALVLVAPRGLADVATSANVAPKRLADVATSANVASTDDDDAGAFPGEAQTLAAHTAAVEEKVCAFALRSGLAPARVADLVLAARLHDRGKLDRRFQRLLADGDPFGAASDALAKSARGHAPRGAWQRIGLPPGWRHEALSVRLALSDDGWHGAHDRALVLWLVGSHHGHGRPLFPHEDPADAADRWVGDTLLPAGHGPQAPDFRLEGERCRPTEADPHDLDGLDWSSLFVLLRERYGPWGLARMEAVLRLADHRASEGP